MFAFLILMGCPLGLETYNTIEGGSDSGTYFNPDCEGVDEDGDGFTDCDDCDDADALTFPGAATEESTSSCMTDADGDGFGAQQVTGSVDAGTDCDDADANIYPGATEVSFDDIDQDCDGEDLGTTVSATGNGDLAITDYSTTDSVATISGCGEVADVTITVDIRHSYIGDLEVSLQAPSSPPIMLHDRSGGGASDISGTYAINNGTLIAAQSLNPLLGTNGDGYWRLSIYDGGIGDSGRLVSWSVALDCL